MVASLADIKLHVHVPYLEVRELGVNGLSEVLAGRRRPLILEGHSLA